MGSELPDRSEKDQSDQPGPSRRFGAARQLLVLVLTLALLAVGGTVAYRRWWANPDYPCQAHGSKPVTSGSPTAAVLGDSYSAGFALEDPRSAWSTVLGRLEGWRTYVEGVSGTGLTTGGPCDGEDFNARLPDALGHDPEILVVQAGLNDAYSPQGSREAALTRLLDQASEVPRVIVVGPPAAPVVRLPVLRRVDGEMRAACRPPRCTYVSTLDWKLPFGFDGVHLTPAGHVAFAALVSESLHKR
jgi:lysophospholipase L1-like esterase